MVAASRGAAWTEGAFVWQSFLDLIKNNQIGDLSSIAGVMITIFGFMATFWGILKSKNAATRAEEAANAAKESIRLFDFVVDFSAAIAILEEIKRAHRQGDLTILPDRYSSTKKLLISIMASKITLTNDQMNVVQEATRQISRIEKQIEKMISENKGFDPAKFNNKITENLDSLIRVLAEIKSNPSRA